MNSPQTHSAKHYPEGNSEYAKTLFTEDAVLFGILNGVQERGSIAELYRNRWSVELFFK